MNCCDSVKPNHFHCPVCHNTFSNLTLFDGHQAVDYSSRPAVSCKEPEALGLVRHNSGTWYTPEGLKSLTERVALMRQAREAKAA